MGKISLIHLTNQQKTNLVSKILFYSSPRGQNNPALCKKRKKKKKRKILLFYDSIFNCKLVHLIKPILFICREKQQNVVCQIAYVNYSLNESEETEVSLPSTDLYQDGSFTNLSVKPTQVCNASHFFSLQYSKLKTEVIQIQKMNAKQFFVNPNEYWTHTYWPLGTAVVSVSSKKSQLFSPYCKNILLLLLMFLSSRETLTIFSFLSFVPSSLHCDPYGHNLRFASSLHAAWVFRMSVSLSTKTDRWFLIPTVKVTLGW